MRNLSKYVPKYVAYTHVYADYVAQGLHATKIMKQNATTT